MVQEDGKLHKEDVQRLCREMVNYIKKMYRDGVGVQRWYIKKMWRDGIGKW